MSETKCEQITLGAGCFWCIEALFQTLKGVRKIVSGYSGGSVKNPTYDDVCDGETGHAEVIQVDFDAKEITFDALLQAFWRCHDPTQLNQQGNDVGTQYRSVIFYHTDEQRAKAELFKKNMNEQRVYGDKTVVTEISPFRSFYAADAGHQNYFNQNGEDKYCQLTIKPKLEKFMRAFASRPVDPDCPTSPSVSPAPQFQDAKKLFGNFDFNSLPVVGELSGAETGEFSAAKTSAANTDHVPAPSPLLKILREL